MDSTTRFDTQVVGALPTIVAYLEKMKLGETIDDVVPWEGDVPLGTLVEVMICNRLLNPKAQYKIGEWARKAGVCDYFDVTEEQLNDDRLGRALERVCKHAFSVQSQLLLHVIKKFKLDVRNIHYDISNVELYGAYERQLGEDGRAQFGPTPAYGRTKSGRKNVKQIQFGLNVARDGAVPIDVLPLDGNQAEVNTHIENLQRLQELLPTNSLVYTADTKLDADENLLQIKVRGGKFLCGGVFQPNLKQEYLKIATKMKTVDYCPKSKEHLPPEERPKYKVYEVKKTIEGTVDNRKVRLTHRLLFVWSEAKAREEAKTRERHIDKIRAEFEAVERNLNKYSLTTEKKILKRLESAGNQYSEGNLFQYDLKKRAGKFSLQWSIDNKELAKRKKLEGSYLIKTSLPKGQFSAADVLREYKKQIHVERRIGDMKGPLAIAPMWLEKPERIAGLLQVLVWALMALALMERDVRRSLKGQPMYGIYPENRPSPAPTGRAILECFETLCVVIVKHKGDIQRRLAELSSVQRQLIEYMGIPPDAMRAFKRKCCHA